MRRVDRRMNVLLTNQPTNQPTDTASFRGALSHLKKQSTQDSRSGGGGGGEERQTDRGTETGRLTEADIQGQTNISLVTRYTTLHPALSVGQLVDRLVDFYYCFGNL